MLERTLEGGASRVHVTSSNDSCVDRIACAGSASLSRLFLAWCNGVMDSVRDFNLLGESVPQVRVSAHTFALFKLFHIYTYIFMF